MSAVAITSHILGVLRSKYQPWEWAAFEEFKGGTATSRWSDRSIDFLAVHLWGDRARGRRSGPHVIGFEIKASRGDFARELREPKKREVTESIATDCFFAVPVGLVKPDEVPEGWGLMEVMRGGKSRVTKQPRQREIDGWPWPVVRSLARRTYMKERPQDHDENTKARRMMIWRIAGLDLTEEEMGRVVEEHLTWAIDAAKGTAKREAVREYLRNNREQIRLRELEEAVKTVTGRRYNPRAEDLLRWAEENTGKALTPEVRRLAMSMRDALDALVKEET